MPRFSKAPAGWTRALALACTTLLIPLPGLSNEQTLPSLGGGYSSANDEEYRLGRAWLRQFRAHAPQWQDPIAHDYLTRAD